MKHNNIYEETQIDKSFDMLLIKRLYKYTKKFIPLIILSTLLLLSITGIDLLRPYIIKVVIDDHIAPKTIYLEEDKNGNFQYNDISYTLGKDDSQIQVVNKTLIIDESEYSLTDKEYQNLRKLNIDKVYYLTILFFFILLIGFVFNYIQIYLLTYIGQKIVYGLREDLFEHLERMSLSFYEKNPIGRLVTRVTNDMNNISEMYTNVLVTFFKDFLIIIGSIVIMLSLNAKLTLIALSTVPLVILSSIIFRIKARNIYRIVRVKLAKINSTLSENISGIKIIQLFNQEKRKYKEFKDINNEHLEATKKEVRIYAVFRPSIRSIYSISLALLLFYGGKDILSGALEFGVLIAFTTYINQFFRPIFDLTEKFNILQAAMASLERIFLLIDEQEDIPNIENPRSIDTIEGSIEFKNVWFEYKKDEPVLRDVSFKANPGETIAFIGATGSGKTTIMNLLTRMYDIQKGEILIDGINIKEYDKYQLRSKISTVLQDVFLFSGDIKKNISLHNPIPLKEIKTVAEFVNASKFIEKFDKQYDSEVTERGSTLSQGQRQLLSFARALAFKPDILILDEATSSIDTETEALIQDAIQKIIKNRTTFVVAHRLSTIKNADKIIVIHKGKIRETGNHNELLKQKGIYYNLYQLQYQ
ncbi:MAG: ABC transporter ATP-binding protein [Clostridiales bacterium]|nr:ABC transporter ATP-binding protein [Clostridiales bacterium]